MQQAASTSQKGKTGLWFAGILASGVTILLMPALFILILVGMVPTWVALGVERGKSGRSHVTGALNAAGLFPFVGRLWDSPDGLSALSEMAGDVFVWAIVYTAAGSAAIALWIGPQIAALYLDFKAARASGRLKRARGALTREWGTVLEENEGGESS